MSALLLITVMKAYFDTLKGNGASQITRELASTLELSLNTPDDSLPNLRFAHEVLLLVDSRQDVVKNTTQSKVEAAKCGRKLHLGQMKIPTHFPGQNAQQSFKWAAYKFKHCARMKEKATSEE